MQGIFMRLKQDVRKIFKRITLRRQVLWVYKGKELQSGLGLTIAIATRAPLKALIISRAFQDEPKIQYQLRCWQWQLEASARSAGAELLVVDDSAASITTIKKNRPVFFIPTWISGVVNFDDAYQRFKTSSYIKRELQKHRSNNLEYEINSDPAGLLENFYHNMYLPFCINRHGSKANAGTLEQLLNDINNKELCCVKKDGEQLAALVLHFQNGGVRGRQLGIKEGRVDIMKYGVVSKLYYHNILALAERGYTSMHFGGCRPFLNDGVLENKLKWGLHLVYEATENRPFLLQPLVDTSAMHNFLKSNPFLTLEDNKIIGHIFLQNSIAVQKDTNEILFNKYWMPGMERLHIHSLDRDDYPIICSKYAK